MRSVYRKRFALYNHEIDLSVGFFTGVVPEYRPGDLASSRTSNAFAPAKTVSSFLNYSYPNGHQGVYPLDTNKQGVLTKLHGTYDIDLMDSNPKDSQDKSWESDNTEKDKQTKLLGDRHFKDLKSAKEAQLADEFLQKLVAP